MTEQSSIKAQILGGANDGLVIVLDEVKPFVRVPVYAKMKSNDSESVLIGFDLCQLNPKSFIENPKYNFQKRIPPEGDPHVKPN